MEIHAYTVALFGIVMLGGLSTLLALRLRSSRRASTIAQNKSTAILAAAVDGIITIDEHGLIKSFNPAAERLFGYRAAEVLGRNVQMLMPEPYRSEHDRYLDNYLTTGRARIIGIGREVVGLRKDGSTFAMELAVGESRSGARRLFAGIVRDISERKKSEQELRDSETKTRAILETAVDGIITIDPQGMILTANPATERIFGYRADELVGHKVNMLMPDPYRGAHDSYLERYLTTGERRIIGIGREVQGRRKDGSVFPMELSVGEAMIGGARIFTGIVRDITDRKRTEEDLRAAKNEAERARVAQSKFLAAVSHDLRQPVQALTLFTSALAAKITGAPASALIEDMRGSVEALDMLLDAMLDMSSLDAGTVVPHETTFSLATLIERLVAEFEPLASQKEIGLRLVPSSAIVRTDPTLLYRILQNFMSNAVRYTSEGGVLIGCRRRGRKLCIDVVDSGIGIPKGLQQEIFKEFFQIGNPERDRTQGLGLGLAIVQRLSRLLHCPITVRSQEGRGSAFGVEVRLVGFNKRANIVPLRPATLEQPATGKGLVFVIDDEPSVLKGLRLVIEDWGYTVLTARTELEAVNILNGRKQAPDVIIADYRLRGICNGAQVVAHIRQTFGAMVPCILITGDTAPERIREANDYGFTLLHKPVEPVKLRAAIAENLSPQATGDAGAG
jgi:two-component system, sensor histidine kinase